MIIQNLDLGVCLTFGKILPFFLLLYCYDHVEGLLLNLETGLYRLLYKELINYFGRPGP